MEFRIISLNISTKKGTVKHAIDSVLLNENGIDSDAHAGNWHRQVSLLSKERIEEFAKVQNKQINPGEFAENITVEGGNLKEVKLNGLFKCGEVLLQVSQIGKKCHGTNCSIFKETGNCIMPSEGIFCKVIKEGKLEKGDNLIYQFID